MQADWIAKNMDKPNNSLHYYFCPPQERQTELLDNNSRWGPAANVAIFDILNQSLTEYHPAVKSILQLKDWETEDVGLRLDTEDDTEASQYISGEVYSITSVPTTSIPNEREIVIFKMGVDTSKLKAQKISPLTHALYEPLTYPLLHFHGEHGWTINNRKTLGLHAYSSARLLIPEVLLPGSDASSDEYMTYTTNDGTKVPCSRLQSMPWLAQQWSLDMACRELENTLKWHLNNQDTTTNAGSTGQKKRKSDRGAVLTANEPSTNGGGVYLHKSFHGGPRFLAEQTANAMSVVRKRGRPLAFVTFTMNPLWLELQEMLPVNCSPRDCPDIVNRVFKKKLDAFIAMLVAGSFWGPRTLDRKTKLFEDKEEEVTVWAYEMEDDSGGDSQGYIIHVIEYQLRGFPHAHIVFRPAHIPDGALSTCHAPGDEQPWADHFVCARKPTMDVLIEYGLLEKNSKTPDQDNTATVSRALLAQPFSTLRRLFPDANLHPKHKPVPTPNDVCHEMKRLVTGTKNRPSMDGFGTKYTKGPLEHGPHPYHDHRPAPWCKQTQDKKCCKGGYPHSSGPTRTVENGFISYHRRSLKDYQLGPKDKHGNHRSIYVSTTQTTHSWTEGGDDFIVPYSPWALLFFKCHLNTEIAATVHVIGASLPSYPAAYLPTSLSPSLLPPTQPSAC